MGNGQDDPVLPGRFGQHLIKPTKQDGSWFERALRIAELPPMTIHELRHTAATLATKPSAVPCRVTWERLPDYQGGGGAGNSVIRCSTGTEE